MQRRKREKGITLFLRRWISDSCYWISALALAAVALYPSLTYPVLIERVVAIVNDEVILLSEFNKAYEGAQASGIYINEEEMIVEMIDRILLLKEAKKFRVNSSNSKSDEQQDITFIINEYIDKRIKTFIYIPYDEIERYYRANMDMYTGREVQDVRDEIEKHLMSEELKIRLQAHMQELRKKAFIRIQLQTKGEE